MSDNSIKAMCGYAAGPNIMSPSFLDRLPIGSVVLDKNEEAWQKTNDTTRRDERGDRLRYAWVTASWNVELTSMEIFQGHVGPTAHVMPVGPVGLLYAPADASASAGDVDYTPDILTLRSEYIYSRRTSPYSGEWRDAQDAQHGAEFDRFVVAYTAEVRTAERLAVAESLRSVAGGPVQAFRFVAEWLERGES